MTLLLVLAALPAFGQAVGMVAAADTVIVPAGGSVAADLYFPIRNELGGWEGRILTDQVGQGPADSILAGWQVVQATSSDTLALLPFVAAAIDTNRQLAGVANWVPLVTGKGFANADSVWYRVLPGIPSDTLASTPVLRSWTTSSRWEGILLRVTVYGSEDDTVAVHGEWRWRQGR